MYAAKFVVLHATVAALVFALWRAGAFALAPDLGWFELCLVGLLCLYSVPGFLAVIQQRWEAAGHVANGIPMWGLALTGIGMLVSVAQLKALTPDAMAQVFRNLAFSITPNIVGVVLMAWIRELAWWLGREKI
jgi:hypothetical protein